MWVIEARNCLPDMLAGATFCDARDRCCQEQGAGSGTRPTFLTLTAQPVQFLQDDAEGGGALVELARVGGRTSGRDQGMHDSATMQEHGLTCIFSTCTTCCGCLKCNVRKRRGWRVTTTACLTSLLFELLESCHLRCRPGNKPKADEADAGCGGEDAASAAPGRARIRGRGRSAAVQVLANMSAA